MLLIVCFYDDIIDAIKQEREIKMTLLNETLYNSTISKSKELIEKTVNEYHIQKDRANIQMLILTSLNSLSGTLFDLKSRIQKDFDLEILLNDDLKEILVREKNIVLKKIKRAILDINGIYGVDFDLSRVETEKTLVIKMSNVNFYINKE